ncbi:MAG: hypothetical protein MZU97_00730 [Bacillus subtilis]|nr:hypothetical protein [Bacillus subtilis]
MKNYRANDFEFDLEGMVKFEGQTGPYLQYTFVRIQFDSEQRTVCLRRTRSTAHLLRRRTIL